MKIRKKIQDGIEFLKVAKNPRIGFQNAILLRKKLLNLGEEVCLHPTEWYNNLFLRPHNTDYEVFNQIFRFTSYGAMESLGDIKTVIDAGANIGLSSVYFSKRLNSPEIVALEPEEKNYAQAVKNIANLPRISLLKKALWSNTGKGSILNPESTSWDFQIVQDDDGPIECITVSEILALKKWQTVDLFKIDIEGAEREIFESPEHMQWLNKVRVFAIELHDKMVPGCSLAFFRAIARLESIEVLFSGENLVVINKALLK